MAFSAIHPDAGRVDATLPDLGCALAWDLVHKVRPRVALRCRECGHGMHAKVSPRGLRYSMSASRFSMQISSRRPG